MSSDKITVNVKFQGDNIYKIETSPDETILKFKELISEQTKVEPSNQKVIFKGKILKDADTLSTYKVENGSTMHMVQSIQSSTTDNKSTTSNTSTNNTSNQNQN